MGVLKLIKEAFQTATSGQGKIWNSNVTGDNNIWAITDDGVRHRLSTGRNGLNYIHNGDFQVNQRIATALTNFTGTTTGRTITIDRWGHTTGNVTTPQFQQVDTSGTPESNLDARFYGLYKQLTNAAKICVSQVLEGREMMRLRNKKVRVQVKLKKTVGADKTICLGLLQLTNAGTIDTIPATFISAFNGAGVDPTFGTNLSLINPDTDKLDNVTHGTTKLNCAITASWQRFSGVFTIPSNCKNLILVIFSNDTLAANDDLCISEVDIHEGEEINVYQALNFRSELDNCQRFFCKSFTYSTVPAQNAGATTGAERVACTVAGAVTNSVVGYFRFPVSMRATPTLTFYNPAAANAFARNITAATDATATSSFNPNTEGTGWNCTGLAAWTVGQDISVHWSANAEL